MFRLIYFLLIGLAAGWIANQFMAGGRAGVIGMLVVGVVGSFIGGFVIRLLGFSKNGTIAEIITAAVGAIVLVFLLQTFG